MESFNSLQIWIAQLDRRTYALLVGLMIGAAGAGVGLLIALVEPLIAAGIIAGALAALYVITNTQAAFMGVIAVMALLPFGTFPFRIGFTPTLLDATLGAFVLVYLLQWATGKRRDFHATPVHLLILIYVGWLLLTFVLGLQWGPPTPQILRGFVETIVSIGLTFTLVDMLRTPQALRRVVIIVLALVGTQALLALVLYALPDGLTESLLVRLSPIGYPDGGVVRYIENNPTLAERAIGTWIDPNALGGILAVTASMIAPQLFAQKPVLRNRGLTAIVMIMVVLALILTYSRASLLAFGIGLCFIGLLRYRRILAILSVGIALVLVLPQTQGLVERFVDAFTAQDLATQMRLGEYSDALRLIGRYPVFGVGFTGTPDIDLYTNVASLYLIMANQIGIAGLLLFLLTMAGVIIYGLAAWRRARPNSEIDGIFLGYHAALVTALVNATADLYFFRLDFHASITLFWLTVALALASARLARAP
jgi:O-antigen ligase